MACQSNLCTFGTLLVTEMFVGKGEKISFAKFGQHRFQKVQAVLGILQPLPVQVKLTQF